VKTKALGREGGIRFFGITQVDWEMPQRNDIGHEGEERELKALVPQGAREKRGNRQAEEKKGCGLNR